MCLSLCSTTELGTHAITHYNSLWPKLEFGDEVNTVFLVPGQGETKNSTKIIFIAFTMRRSRSNIKEVTVLS